METGEGSWQHRYWSSAEGLRLHARDYPAAEGPARLPVICLHGVTRNGRDFDVLGEALAPTHRVLAIDMPGRGASDWLRAWPCSRASAWAMVATWRATSAA